MQINCPYCDNSHLYKLKDGRFECSNCKHRFSKKKIEKSFQFLDAFINGLSPKEASAFCGATLPTIRSYFNLFRSLLPAFLDEIYQQESSSYNEYEEYLYLPASMRKKKECLIYGIGIIALYGNGGVYTLLMPDHWKNLDEETKKNPDFIQTLAHYYQWNKLVRIESYNTPIGAFWLFLEEFMKPFHGIKEEYFGLYLKEAEFRFNYTKEKQAHHMMRLWKSYLKQNL